MNARVDDRVAFLLGGEEVVVAGQRIAFFRQPERAVDDEASFSIELRRVCAVPPGRVRLRHVMALNMHNLALQ